MEKEVIMRPIVAGVVLERDGRYLFVQEKTPTFYGLWGLPAGKVNVGETIEQAAVREAKEESGYDVELVRKIGIFQDSVADATAHIFEGNIMGGELKFPEDELLDAKWLTLDEVRRLKAEGKLRRSWMLKVICHKTPYRFSSLRSKNELLEAVRYVHLKTHELCKQVFGRYLPASGDITVFSHYDDEYEFLTRLRKELTDGSDTTDGKYFRLHEPFVFRAQGDVPPTTYIFLYIRHPDPYRSHIGDAGFYLEPAEYEKLKQSLLAGEQKRGARLFERPEMDMLEFHDPDVDVLAYVYPRIPGSDPV